MCAAQHKIDLVKKIAAPSLGVAILLANTVTVFAGSNVSCAPNASCTVGEYVFDDDYNPDTLATCTFTSKYPDGSSHITSQSLTSTSDAWYGYTFTAPTTTGYYRGQICCTVNSENMCIDKSFDVKESEGLTQSNIANSVWDYSSRTLTSFNDVVTDIWSYTTRSLTAVNTTSDITSIKKTVEDTRLLMEGLVNKPIIENSLEEFKDFDLIGKVKDGQKASSDAYLNILLVDSSLNKLTSSWNKQTNDGLIAEIDKVKESLGEESDTSDSNTLFAKINYLRDLFGYKEADLMYEDALALKDSLNYTQTTLSVSGKDSKLVKELKSSISYLRSSEKLLTVIDKRLKEAEGLSKLIDNNLKQANNVLGVWNESTVDEKNNTIESIQKNTISLNRIPKIQNILSSVYENIIGDKKLKNRVYTLQAILLANKKMVVSGGKDVVLANWLEEGSLVIKTLITNPSTLIAQDVPLKYYLPKELKKENILETDTGLEVKYDTEKGQLFVEGQFKLKAGETRTVKVRVDDVWVINKEELDSLKGQAESLVKPLEKSSFYAQGITLKSDIDVSVSKVSGLIKENITPESKIENYREAQIEIVSIKEKIEKLKDFVSQASSSGSILGFVGGSQAIAVWGIIVAVVAGFVFMTIYMKKLVSKEDKLKVAPVKNEKITNFDKVAIFVIVSFISALSTSIAVKKLVIPTITAKEPIQVSQNVLGKSTVDIKNLKVVKLISIDGVVKIYQDEGTDTILELVDDGTNAIEVERGEKRVKVVLNNREVWVEINNVL